MFLFLNEAYPKFSSYPTPDYAFKTHLRTCTIISYILFCSKAVHFLFSSPTLVNLRLGVLTKLVLTNKKKCIKENIHKLGILKTWGTRIWVLHWGTYKNSHKLLILERVKYGIFL